MILDYSFNKFSHNFSLSYIDDSGNKRIMDFGAINHFKTFYYTPTGTFTAWNGAKCDVKYTDSPSKFDLIRFLRELPEDKKKLLQSKTYPKMYTFDIENTFVAGEEPDPVGARNDITTISIVSPELNTVVLGTLKLDEQGLGYVQENFDKYVDGCEYFHTLDLDKPSIRYIYFEREHDMLEYFLKNIVAKVPILAGWNSIGYDWIYICNRIKNFFPDLSIKMSSIVGEVKRKTYINLKNEKIDYLSPLHTIVIDLMDYIKNDHSVMPIKESMSLNYISLNSIGVEKIDYDGDLMDLLRTDPARYVYYNAIDSILVRLIEYRFKQLDQLYMYSIILEDKFENVDLTIPPTETAVFNDFYENHLQVVNEDRDNVVTPVMGAYVKEPIPGKYEYISCNDFASLYPSTVITCNLSFENFVGAFYDEDKMKPYRDNPVKYICIGCNVHENDGTREIPKAGKFITRCIDIEKIKPYINDPNYFVTVNAHVYHNDKEYSFSRIQNKFKQIRGQSKYLSKDLDATVLLDIEHLLEGKTDAQMHKYSDRVVNALKELGYDLHSGDDVKNVDDLMTLKRKVSNEIAYLVNREQSVKLLMNGMYGGTTHPAFFWFSEYLGNDITGEARSVIHLMEKHFESFWNENWALMDEYHKKWGIEVDKERIPIEISNSPSNSLATIIYGDSVDGSSMIHTDQGDMTIEDMFNICYNKYGISGIDDHGSEHVVCPYKSLNYVDGNIVNSDIKDIIRHRVCKKKWRIVTESGKEIFVTEDHSIVVFRDGMRIEVKPTEIQYHDKLCVNEKGNISYERYNVIECVGEFEDEYVYDIEMDDESHTFFANDILVHNTDSLYISYAPLLNTIKGFDQLTPRQKMDIIASINTDFLNKHNFDYIKDYYDKRHAKSVHEFELETIARGGIWLNVKKRYAQVIMWKDGKIYDEDEYTVKSKGLEIIKSSYPAYSRKCLKELVKELIVSTSPYLLQELNFKMQQIRNDFMTTDIENICGSMSVHNYTRFIKDDTQELVCEKGTPFHVRALAYHNYLIHQHNIPEEPMYGGKMKWYRVKKMTNIQSGICFAFQARHYPKWADKLAPIDRVAMFEQTILEPFNRILEAIGMNTLRTDGSIQAKLF